MNKKDFNENKEILLERISRITFSQLDLTSTKKDGMLLLGTMKYIHLKEMALKNNHKTSVINHVYGSTFPMVQLMIQIEDRLQHLTKTQSDLLGKKRVNFEEIEKVFKKKHNIEIELNAICEKLEKLLE